MNTQSLLMQIQAKIAEANEAQSYDKVMLLGSAARQVMDIEGQLKALVVRLDNLDGTMALIAPSAPSASWIDKQVPQSDEAKSDDYLYIPDFAVVIHIPEKEPIYIHDKHASKTLRKTVEAVVQIFGAACLPRLAAIPANRGFLTDNPKRDFWNSAAQRVYQHQPITGTDFYVLTNNSTPEKIQLIELMRRGLGLGPGAIKAYTKDTMPEDVKAIIGIKML